MLPNYLLSLVNPKAEKVKVMNYLYLAEAEKSDLIFCCHRPFASIFVFLHIHFFVAHKNTLLCYISFCICPYACIFLIVDIFSIPFFILYYIFFFFLLSQCILNSSLSQMPNIPLNSHWKTVMLVFQQFRQSLCVKLISSVRLFS